ncbi:MAG: M20/M25/M40 family metallo-hydrolase [Desulfobacterales bacterium]
MVDIHKLVSDHKDLIINTRRELHRIPEIGYTEEKTSAYVANYLSREGLEVQTGIAQFGVVGLLETGKSGPTLMIRADMDALLLTEETGLEFASTHDGVMHACGHDAHMCIDALEVGTQVVNALQRISSRHMHPLEATVVTVGSFHAGTTFNIIPGEAEMCGTTRTFNLDIWDSWEQRLEKVIRGVCESMGADYELKFSKGYPPTVNDDDISEVVRRCAAEVVGLEKVVVPEQTMGGEDMSYFLQRSKGCFFALGAGREGYAPVHNPKFMFNEDILLLGVETHCRVALELLGSY